MTDPSIRGEPLRPPDHTMSCAGRTMRPYDPGRRCGFAWPGFGLRAGDRREVGLPSLGGRVSGARARILESTTAAQAPRTLSHKRLSSNPMTERTPLAIEATGLVKHFDSSRAVDGVDLAVPSGWVYGVLG